MKLVAFLFFSQVAAQSVSNGISKSTYSCNDPIAAKEFLYKYFPVSTPFDECTNDVCICNATSSTPEWYIQQGRVYVNKASATGEESHRSQDDPEGNGFGLHCVNVSNHLTTGGLSTAEVEAHFNSKLGDMSTFDSFMDFSTTFYTPGLEQYAAAFDKDGVPYYTMTWQDETSQIYTSLIVQVAKSQMILELTSRGSVAMSATRRSVHSAVPTERRLSPRTLALILELEQKSEASETSMTALSVNRAASADVMARIEDFYVTGMGTKKVSDDADASTGYARKCFLWSGSEVDICFTSRADNATKGDWKVEDFENMLNTVHKNIIVEHPLCGVDKWVDNHYAIDNWHYNGTASIVSYIEENRIPHACNSVNPTGKVGLHYIFDPTGWGIQADLGFSTMPKDCNIGASSRLTGTFNPACEPGTCGASPSLELVV